MLDPDQETAALKNSSLAEIIERLRQLIDNPDQKLDRGAILSTLADLNRNEAKDGQSATQSTHLVFDVSDLLGYYARLRSPTGVQRVQMEVIGALLSADSPIRICRFLPLKGVWVEVAKSTFERLSAASRAGGPADDPQWVVMREKADEQANTAAPLVPHPGSILVNLGSSWWLSDYSLQVRALKDQHGVHYVPFIHDVIPAVAPELCDGELVGQFTPWICEVLDNADFILTNSEASKNDILKLAEAVGRDVPAGYIAVIPLDADYRSHTEKPAKRTLPPRTRPHVLLTSTIEARKNQSAALDAWFELLTTYPSDAIPQLILVGRPGFRSKEIYDRIATDTVLAPHVTVLQDVDDADLAELYRESLFTLYPSSYEGWGLPVTEALCYGKIPLIADNSSLPEAGGKYAVFFATGSTVDLVAKLKQLIFDPKFRNRQEALIAGFRPRNWIEIAKEIANSILSWQAQLNSDQTPTYPLAEIGSFYPLYQRPSRGHWKGMGSAEGFRRGTDWWSVEEGGCWSKPAGGLLAMSLDPTVGYEFAFELVSASPEPARGFVGIEGGEILVDVDLEQGCRRWAFARAPSGNTEIIFRIWSDRSFRPQDDHRVMGVGLRGFFVLKADDFEARKNFVEAVALGALADFNHYRRRPERHQGSS